MPEGHAISLGCNIHALQYLKEKDWFKKDFSKEDKLELLAKAKRFQNTNTLGYNYLLNECGIQINPFQNLALNKSQQQYDKREF